ncbi:MAG TPA: LLM class flavin-dependent oxidoreductase [Dehalococcoidia bacterium]|nr:LLM class flavin-dependent oxidoreductase [Dehalococcoidia bacterium]
MIGVYIPSTDARSFIDNIKQAEAAGVPSFWLTTGGLLPDIPTVFAAAAMVTSKIKLGTSITQTWPRHPVALASQCIALSQIAPGRFRVGLGASHQPAVEAMYGVKYEKPLTNLREHLFVLTELLRKGEVDFAGAFVKCTAKLGGGPLPSTIPVPIDVPVMISALRPASFRLAGELADGAISWVCPWNYLRDVALVEMKKAAVEANRPAPALVAHVNVCLTTDREAAREAARAQIGRYGNLVNYRGMFEWAGFADPTGADQDRLIDTLCVSGSEAEVSERLATIIHEGASEIIAHPIYYSEDRAAENEATLKLAARANKEAGIKV